jgi:LmbE family N-acetylglucosaminyl deacetylase
LISPDGSTVSAIEDAVKSCLPDLIYTHCGADRHQEHRAVYEATLLAARKVSHLLTYQSPSSTLSFRPQRYINIEEVLEDKLALVASYRSVARESSDMQPEHIESTARYWGRFTHSALVEAFEVVREVSGVHSDLYSSRRAAPEPSYLPMRKSS